MADQMYCRSCEYRFEVPDDQEMPRECPRCRQRRLIDSVSDPMFFKLKDAPIVDEGARIVICGNRQHRTPFEHGKRPSHCGGCGRPITPDDLARDIAEGKAKY